MNGQLEKLWEQLRTSFWFVPTLMVIGASALAVATVWLDESQRFAFVADIGWIYSGGADGARSLLSSVASSIITVAGVTFSITIAALTLASSQFGPRLLRNFVRDTGNQVVLGTFIATFMYCLLVLRTVRGVEDIRFVPHISVTVGVGLTIASLGVLIYFIHHVATTIQVEHIIDTVGSELDDVLDRIFPEEVGSDPQPHEQPGDTLRQWHTPSDEGYAVTAINGGYIQVIEADKLMEIARTNDLVIELVRRPGDFVVRGDALVRAWPSTRGDAQFAKAINTIFILGKQRTTLQDVVFAASQLVEIAVRALSPGINDPFTAISCIDRLAAALCRTAERTMPSPYRYDTTNTLRVIAPSVTFSDLVHVGFDQIRHNSQSQVDVTLHLLDMLARIAAHTDDHAYHQTLLQQADAIMHDAQQELGSSSDWQTIVQRHEKVACQIT